MVTTFDAAPKRAGTVVPEATGAGLSPRNGQMGPKHSGKTVFD